MKLLTKEILNAFEKQGDTSTLKPDQTKVVCKFFNPTGRGTWYAVEYNPETDVCFGLCCIQENELGYFSMAELKDYRGFMGLGIERDIHFPILERTLSEVMELEGKNYA